MRTYFLGMPATIVNKSYDATRYPVLLKLLPPFRTGTHVVPQMFSIVAKLYLPIPFMRTHQHGEVTSSVLTTVDLSFITRHIVKRDARSRQWCISLDRYTRITLQYHLVTLIIPIMILLRWIYKLQQKAAI